MASTAFALWLILPSLHDARLFDWLFPTASAAGLTVTSTNDSGPGSLRQAILDANSNSGVDTISFNIAGAGAHTISPTSPLPVVTDALVIDGTTQPGYSGAPIIELDGTAVTGDGISISAGNCVVRGLVLNRFHGNAIKLAGDGNVVEVNYVGTDTSGTLRKSNTVDGVLVSGSNNTIGGTTPQSRNLISGNVQSGVHLTGGASGNIIEGNYIGLDVTGNVGLGNNNGGVVLQGTGSNNIVGGSTVGARNIISANISLGVCMCGGPNKLQGNYIGANVDGTKSVVNAGTAVQVGSANNLIGGITTTPGAPPGNLIMNQATYSASGIVGIFIFGTGTVIQGNLFGTNASGTATLGNVNTTGSAIECWGSNTMIGGAVDGARNVISGNVYGIEIGNSGQATIQGNFIGTDITGTKALGNRSGIEVITANNVIGGTTPLARNVISGNLTGIALRAGATTIQGNFIGTDASGSGALPNTNDGIVIYGYADNLIGGTAAGAGNVIAYNGANGIAIVPSARFVPIIKHAIRHNSIFSNNLLGIDLVSVEAFSSSITGFAYDGVTFNDAGDSDSGPNNLQNFPVIQSVATSGGSTTIQGTLNSTANASFTLDFFSSSRCNASGFGEGANYIGTTTVATDGGGNAAFNINLPVTLSSGQVVTATATDASGSTSEFSACNEVNAPGSFQFASLPYVAREDAGTATITVTRTLGTASSATVGYSTSDGTADANAGAATTGADFAATSGTLVFGPGETVKSFSIPIINDSLHESFYENVNLTLSSPTGGAVLGGRNKSVLRIQDDDSPPGISVGNVTITEGDAAHQSATFTVSLTAASGLPVTVDYSTQDNTAKQSSDYTLSAGTLTFAPGETVKTFNVLITDDAYVEGSETAFVLLRNLNGAFNAGSGGAVLTILDNDTQQPTTNPIDDAQFFVRQHYYDFLSRLPDDGGLAYWSSQITQCGSDAACIDSRRVGVSAAYFIELEFQETGNFVYRFYKASYGQRPTYSQFMPDRARVVGGDQLEASKQQFAADWVNRPEFLNKYPAALTGQQFIDALLQTVLQGSGIDLSGQRQALIDDYAANQSRARIVRLVADSQAFQQAEYNRAFVLMQYFGYLRRDPDEGGYNFWLDVLNNRVPGNYRSMVCAFITSAEYQQRFSPVVTRNDHICGSINQ